eukprot:1051407-Prorocentrum_minimum.AAC.3
MPISLAQDAWILDERANASNTLVVNPVHRVGIVERHALVPSPCAFRCFWLLEWLGDPVYDTTR